MFKIATVKNISSIYTNWLHTGFVVWILNYKEELTDCSGDVC